jgi:UDP-N-acetylmuramyl pentapeptide synthase
VWTYGLEEGNDVRAVDIVLDWPHGMRFTALVRGSTQPVRLPLLGRHMVPSALAALAVAAIEGVPLARAAAAIGAMPPAGARLEILPLADGATLVCDHHKNSVETIRAALELVAEVAGRKLLVISRVRDMTDELLPSLVVAAKLLARVVDEIIVVGDGVEALVAATLAEGFPPGRVHQAAPGAADALRRLRAAMRPGDVVLLKGRIAQKLDRLVLALQGRRVVCDLADCQLISLPCEHCPMREVGFGTRVKFG